MSSSLHGSLHPQAEFGFEVHYSIDHLALQPLAIITLVDRIASSTSRIASERSDTPKIVPERNDDLYSANDL